MLKKISSVVAAVAMTLTGLGALPAQAVNYAPNADSNIISSSWRKTTGTDSVISVPSTGVQRASFRRQWTFDGTAASQVVGKTITVSYTVTAPDGSAVAGSGNLYLSGYMTNLQTQGDLYFNENTPGTGLVMTPAVGQTYNYAYVNIDYNLYSGMTPLQVGNYTISNLKIKADGVELTSFGTSAGQNTAYISTNEINVSTAYSAGTSTTVGFGSGTYDKFQATNITCLNTSLLAAGDVVTVRHLTDGVPTGAGTSDISRTIYAYLGTSESTNIWMNSNSITLTADQASKGIRYRSYSDFFNAANTSDSRVNANTSISAGTHTFGLSVTKADGTEVTGPCSPAAPPAPSTVTLNGSQLSVSGTGTFPSSVDYYCQAYNNATNVAVGSQGWANTSNYTNGNYGNLSCSLSGLGGGITIYVKFIAKSRDFSSWSATSAASQTVDLPAVGYAITSTATNGTAWGTVKALPLLDSAAVTNANPAQPIIDAKAEPTGGIYEYNIGGGQSGVFMGIRRILATGLDSSFGLKSISFGSNAFMPTGGWHGTLTAPRPMGASFLGGMNPSDPATLQLTDFTSTGATGNTRTVSNADLNALCAGAAGSGFTMSTMGLKLISAPTADVWFSAVCTKSGVTPLQSQILAKVSLTGTAAPVLITQINVPDSTYPSIYTIGSMNGPSLPLSVNPTATGTTPMVTILALPRSTTMTYGQGKIVRVTSAGAVSSTDMNLTIPSGTTVSQLAPLDYNLGDVIVNVMLMTQGTPTSSVRKLGATGADTDFTPTWDADTNLPDASSRVTSIIGKTSTGETVFLRRVSVAGQTIGAKIRMAKINFTTGAVTTFGELITANYSSGALSYALPVGVNGAAFVSQSSATAGKWNALIINGQSSIPTPPPAAVPSPTQSVSTNLGLGLNAGGNKIEITGTLLTAVTGVTFNGVALPAGSIVKTATKVTITVPAGTTGIVPVALVHAGGTIPVGNYEYIGATKVAQTIAISSGSEIFSVGDADRVLAPTSTFDDDADANTAQVTTGLTVAIVSKTPAICTVSQNLLHFVASGTCTIEGTQAGDARYAAGTKVTKVFYVLPTYTGASALYSTDGGKPTITLTGTGLTSVNSVKLGGQVVTDVKSNATGTLLTVKIPVASADNANANTVDLKLVYGTGNELDTQDDFTFVGGTKVTQTIAFTTSNSATYGDAIRELNATSTDSNNNVLDVVIAYKSNTPAVCSVIDGDVRFLTGGNCVIVASQAGNAGVAAAAPVTQTIAVAKKAQVITIADTTLAITDVETIASGIALDSAEEMDLEYAVNNEDICTIDGEGVISGVSAGTCVITVSQAGDARYLPATSGDGYTVTVEVSTSNAEPVDMALADGDGSAPAASIGSGGLKTFATTNDPGFQLAWDKATGKLLPRASGIYTGFIQVKMTFVKNSVTYTCTNVFGSNVAMKNKKPAEKKAAKANKIFTTTTAFCTDPNEIKPSLYTSIVLTPANFAKIKPSAKAAGAVGTAGTKKYEAAAFALLKNFNGPVSFEIKRFRAWPTTGVNVTGDKKNGKKIPVTTRNTSVVLQ